MAHANPEFALGLMRHDPVPVSQQINKARPLSFARMRAEIRRIGGLVRDDAPLTLREAELWSGYTRGIRRTRELLATDLTTSYVDPPAGGMHAGSKRGERFTEPKRRWPADVQAGRTRPTVGTFSR